MHLAHLPAEVVAVVGEQVDDDGAAGRLQNAPRFGEHRVFETLGLPIEGLGDGFSWKSQDLAHSAQLARDGWQKARDAILEAEKRQAALLPGPYKLVVLDPRLAPIDLPLETGANRITDQTVLLVFRGLTVLFFAVYSSATVAFGWKFSNLTNRATVLLNYRLGDRVL